MQVVISRAVSDAIVGEAAARPDEEVCGLLFGVPGRIMAVRALANVAERRGDTFELDPAALIAAYRAQRAGGPAVIGCYHSHPNGKPTPSHRDRAAAQPGTMWLIVGGGIVRAWLAGEDGFTEARLIVTDDGTLAGHAAPNRNSAPGE
ncbi:M67 family metallopeptidase [uncultured Sphingomonas sp.]|uniref:M67 family metallopeptidase n=1 Tax=uncultured Sphingomonas sp. TaxID=158754 RepID=UPI0025DEBA90|nr:M67 family metallopeptidase [uncultured Sphingomonas sp.]